MTNCVVLVGPSGSGKTTLAKALEQRGFKRIVTYTTRPKRPGERNGVDYHFISNESFTRKVNAGFFAETTTYVTADGTYYHYGSAKKDYRSKEMRVIILNPEGVLTLKENIFVVFMDLPEEERRKRLINRGDSLDAVEQRVSYERNHFCHLLSARKPDAQIKMDNNLDFLCLCVMDSFCTLLSAEIAMEAKQVGTKSAQRNAERLRRFYRRFNERG